METGLTLSLALTNTACGEFVTHTHTHINISFHPKNLTRLVEHAISHMQFLL